ncbi:hypothetical protein BDN72DRAFT_860667 [Pluteus cervinus]|uniref:Uncharacterized protein n=1 Tax=Pluteus cervinus TaxID=181527 RepID=A0ACD3AI78_9AGAR|nr:hypothetical protein BDN72DRAFT_860667 [Pluteus cervinus]
MSIAHALAVADALRHKVADAASDPRNLATTPEEIIEGRAAQQKTHLSDKDPNIKNTVDNWPALYSKDWTLLGDCLPDSSFAGLVPFATLSQDHEVISFQLVALALDGTLTHMTSDQLTPQSKWEPLNFVGDSSLPQFTKIAYWNNTAVGFDDASKTWDITIKFDELQTRPKSILSRNLQRATKDSVLEWKRWIEADGVVNIGVASPGVVLDMHLLTRTLKTRYLDVQSVIYPVVENISAFCATHEFYLDNVYQDSQDFMNASSQEQQDMALQDAQSFVTHAKTWAKIVSESVLSAQLQILRDKLKQLEATLDSEEQQMSTLKAELWAATCGALLGLAIIVVGMLTGNLAVLFGGGILMAGGIVVAAVIGRQISELAADISATNSQIDAVTTAITEMSDIVSLFTDLDSLYGTLNEFWGGLNNDASRIGVMDNATATEIGFNMLGDPSSIQASMAMTTDMGEACDTYLSILNRQGVVIPSSFEVAKVTSTAGIPLSGHALGPVFSIAQDALRRRDFDGYQSVIKYATLLHTNAAVEKALATAGSGLWFDVPQLRGASNVWLEDEHNFLAGSRLSDQPRTGFEDELQPLIDDANALDYDLSQIKPAIVGSLNNIVTMSGVLVDWIQQFPEAPTDPDDIAKLEQYQQDATRACKSAMDQAASANNTFVNFNQKATALQQDAEAEVNTLNDAIAAKNAYWDSELANVPGVHFDYPVRTIGDVIEDEVRINFKRNQDINPLKDEISQLKDLESSGASFNGHVGTWGDMAQTISGNLGTVHNALLKVWGQLYEDPILYSSIIHGEWATVAQDAKDVLAILNNSTSKLELWSIPRDRLLATTAPTALTTPTADSGLVQAILPSTTLSDCLSTQSDAVVAFFNSLNALLQLPSSKGIVGSWDATQTKPQTFYNVAISLRNDCVHPITTEYQAIVQLQHLAVLLDFRASQVLAGKLPLKSLFQSTLASVKPVLKVSQTTYESLKDTGRDLGAVLDVVSANISALDNQLAGLKDNVDELEQQEREEVIFNVANCIAVAFPAPALLASFGMIGSVTATVLLAVQLGSGADVTASNIRTVLETLSSSDLAKVIQSLKVARSTLTDGLDGLKKIQLLFRSVLTGVGKVNNAVDEMKTSLGSVKRLGSDLVFMQGDVEGIKVAWAKIRDDAQDWLDAVDGQNLAFRLFVGQHIGLNRKQSREKWTGLKASDREFIDFSPSAPPVIEQEDNVERVTQTILYEAPQYFVERRVQGADLLRRYVFSKARELQLRMLRVGRPLACVKELEQINEDRRQSRHPAFGSKLPINLGNEPISDLHAHRYLIRGPRILTGISMTHENGRLSVSPNPDALTSQRRYLQARTSPRPRLAHQFQSPIFRLPPNLEIGDADQGPLSSTSTNLPAAQRTPSPGPSNRSPRSNATSKETHVDPRPIIHRYQSRYKQETQFSLPRELLLASPLQLQAPLQIPAGGETSVQSEVLARENLLVPAARLPKDDLEEFLETRCQRPLRHLYPFLRLYGCRSMDDIRLIAQWPLAFIKQVITEVKRVVPISQRQKVEMLDWDILAYSISRVGTELGS